MSGMEGGKEGRDQMEKDRGRTGFHAAAHDAGGGASNGELDDARVDLMGADEPDECALHNATLDFTLARSTGGRCLSLT